MSFCLKTGFEFRLNSVFCSGINFEVNKGLNTVQLEDPSIPYYEKV